MYCNLTRIDGNLRDQRAFLLKCKKNGVVPNGLKRMFSLDSRSDRGKRYENRVHMRLLKDAISKLHWRIEVLTRKVFFMNQRLQASNLGSRFYHDIDRMFQKKSENQFKLDERRLKKKFRFLRIKKEKSDYKLKEKRMMKERIEKAKIRCKRKTVYNFGSKEISEEQNEVLSKMGLGFQFTPKEFPIVELVQATELKCQQIERLNPEVIEERERAQKIRHVVMDHILENHRKKIKRKVSKKEMKMLIELKKDEDRLITSADKGKAIAIEDKESYQAKNQQQLDEMDCVKANKSGKTLLRELHRKLVSTLKSMGLSKKE